MKNFDLKRLLPHGIAVILFLVVSLIYCKPALEGKVLQQSDISSWKCSIQNSIDYSKTHDGKYPLWSNGLFSGMPAFQIGGVGGNYVATYIHPILTLGLPKPMQFFFLASLCFYILCCCLRINPWVGIVGGLAYAYATYNPIIVGVGHDTKMLSIAYMPALLGAVMLILQKKYLVGSILSILFSSLLISMNHLQITYYLFIAIGILVLFSFIQFIREKDFKHLAIAAALSIFSIGIGIATNAEILMSTYEYQKETIRGGNSVLTDTTQKNKVQTTGLDKDYVFSYSLFMTEPLVMLVPHMFGGSSGNEEVAQEKSKAVEAISSMPKELQQQLQLSYYWGGLVAPGSVGTSGPPYAGAIICFLAILSMFVVDSKYKWWMLTAIILTVMMSWGLYFDGFNTFLFNHLPFYNKFRAPSMIIVIPELMLVLMSVLCIQKIIDAQDKKLLLQKLYKGGIATLGVLAFLLICYFSFDFLSSSDKSTLKQVREMSQPQLLETIKSFFDALKEDRKGLMMGDIFRSFAFIAFAFGMIFIYIKNIIKPWILIAALGLFTFIDLMVINNTYLNANNYQEKEQNETVPTASPKDNEILADKSDYRVLNIGSNPFSDPHPSFLYKSIGGYHPAKLRLYQDLIERQLSKQQLNEGVLNMLNTKYIIKKDGAGATQQYQINPRALGPCWFVKHILFVKNADEEMKALDNFTPRDTAFVQEQFKNNIPFTPEYDTASFIKLIKNDNDIITYQSNSSKNQFAVCSEIYYTAGWKAFVDDKEVPIIKTNYVLRGLALPAGKHEIVFKFEPKGYLQGKKLSRIANIIALLILLTSVMLFFRLNRKNGK